MDSWPVLRKLVRNFICLVFYQNFVQVKYTTANYIRWCEVNLDTLFFMLTIFCNSYVLGKGDNLTFSFTAQKLHHSNVFKPKTCS